MTDMLSLHLDALAMLEANLSDDELGYGALLLADEDPQHYRDVIAVVVGGWCALLAEVCGPDGALASIGDMRAHLLRNRLHAVDEAEL